MKIWTKNLAIDINIYYRTTILKNFSQNYFNGSISFNSSGNNDLNDTNVLKTQIINDISYTGLIL